MLKQQYLNCCDVMLVLRQCIQLRVKHIFFIFLIIITIQVLIFSDQNHKVLTTPTPLFASLHKPEIESMQSNEINKNVSHLLFIKIPSEAEYKMNLIRKKIEKLTNYSQRKDVSKLLSVKPFNRPNNKVHVFYNVNYGNPDIDKDWKSWNQGYEFKNNMDNSKLYQNLKYCPPDDIASNFYPEIGCYSSTEHRVINIHFKQIREAGIGVVVITWYLSKSKEELRAILTIILYYAKKCRLKITLHLVNDLEQTPEKLFRSIHHITTKYSIHPAFYKLEKEGKHLAVRSAESQ